MVIARLDHRGLLVVLGAAWGSLLLFVAACLIETSSGAVHTGADVVKNASLFQELTFNPLVRLPEFLMGVSLGKLFLARKSDSAEPGDHQRARVRVAMAFSVLGIIVVLMLGHMPLALEDNVLLDPLFAVLIFGLAYAPNRLAAMLAMPLLTLLGEASYGIYILHYPVWGVVNNVLNNLHLRYDSHSSYFFAAYLSLVIGIALISMRFVEQPARRAIRSLTARTSMGAPAATAQRV